MADPKSAATVAAPPAPGGAVGWSFLRSSRWIGYFALFAIFALACVLLGNWQFDRRAEARAEIDRIDANYDAPAMSLSDAIGALDEFDEDAQKWQTVSVTGVYEGEPFLARNRPGPAGVGSDVIQPLRTEDGALFFVDRGWVAVDGNQADGANFSLAELPQPATGDVTVEVRLRAGEPEISGRSTSGHTVASIDLPELASLTATPDAAYTGAYGMLISETPAGEHGTLPAKPERDEGPHLSYALQWYVFIVIAAIGVAYAARQEFRGLNAGSGAVREQDRRSAVRRKRRGPTDADIEDALLDA